MYCGNVSNINQSNIQPSSSKLVRTASKVPIKDISMDILGIKWIKHIILTVITLLIVKQSDP